MPNVNIPAELLHGWGIHSPRLLANTDTSYVFQVAQAGRRKAVLKLLKPEGYGEKTGFEYLSWRDGSGSVRILECSDPACLLEEAGAETLEDVHRKNGDDAATGVICELLPKLHAQSTRPEPKTLVPLEEHFASLFDLAKNGGQYADLVGWGAAQARSLIGEQTGRIPLHGDLHHGNILRGDDGVWRAIDPHGLIGDRAYEVANVFGNPSGEHLFDPLRIRKLAWTFSEVLGCSAQRILRFAAAHAMLSVAWSLDHPLREGSAESIQERTHVASIIRSLIEEQSV